MENKKSYYAVITSSVLYNDNLTARQKLMFAVITNMSNEKGYCFASNNHLAKITKTSVRTIQRDLSVLEELGFLGRVVKVSPTGEVLFRGLRPLTDGGTDTDDMRGGVMDDMRGHDTDVIIKTNFSKNKKKKNTHLNDITDKDNVFRFYVWRDKVGNEVMCEQIYNRIQNNQHPEAKLLPSNTLSLLKSMGCIVDKGRVKLKA